MYMYVYFCKFFIKSLKKNFWWNHKHQTFVKPLLLIHSTVSCNTQELCSGSDSPIYNRIQSHYCQEVQPFMLSCCIIMPVSVSEDMFRSVVGCCPNPCLKLSKVYNWSWNLNINFKWFHVKDKVTVSELYHNWSSTDFISKTGSDLFPGILPSLLVGTKVT